MNSKYNEAVNKNHKKKNTQKKSTASKPAVSHSVVEVSSSAAQQNYIEEEEKKESDIYEQEQVQPTELVQSRDSRTAIASTRFSISNQHHMVDAEQDFGSEDDDDDVDENQNQMDEEEPEEQKEEQDEEDEEEDHETKNMVILRSRGEWSPKQYSVSSNEEEEDEDPNQFEEENHSEEEETFQRNRNDLYQKKAVEHHDDISVLREILNCKETRQTQEINNYMSNDDESEDLNESLGKTHNEEEEESAAVGTREVVYQVEEEEEKENSYQMEGRRSSLQQLKKDFYERSK